MNNGKLFLVGTPIGNLEDITLRALRILEESDEILCEDTRQTIKLLNHYEIKNHLTSYHKFNEKEALNKVLDKLKKGKNLALVSDAGLPLISDPGSILVAQCRKENIPVEVIPGANAALSALQLSGLDSTRFTFFGFPPKEKKLKSKFMEDVLKCSNTAILYESPYRVKKTLEEILEKDPKRVISISREITKKFEETINGTPEELLNYFNQNPPKGEFVLVINPGTRTSDEKSNLSVDELYNYYINKGFSEKEAMKKVASKKNIKKRDVYQKVKINK